MINKEFSHVNGPKDQAGGCLADLLFCATNIKIYTIQKYLNRFSLTEVYSDQFYFSFRSLW